MDLGLPAKHLTTRTLSCCDLYYLSEVWSESVVKGQVSFVSKHEFSGEECSSTNSIAAAWDEMDASSYVGSRPV